MGLVKNELHGKSEAWSSTSNNRATFNMATGFTAFDLLMGHKQRLVNIKTSDAKILKIDRNGKTFTEKDHASLGTVEKQYGGFASFPITVLGESNTGKSTLTTNIIDNAIRMAEYEFGEENITDKIDVLFFNAEGHTTQERVVQLIGQDGFERFNKFYHKMDSINQISVIRDVIMQYVVTKEKFLKKLEIELPITNNIHQEDVKYTVPTFIFIDSIASLMPEIDFKVDKETNEISYDKDGTKSALSGMGNMADMNMAKMNKQWINEIKPICLKYNIIIFMVNHLKQFVGINPYDPKARLKILPGLPAGAYFIGGNELVYQSGYVLNLKNIGIISSHDKYGQKYNLGKEIDGIMVKAIFVKNKSGIENIEIPLVFDHAKGYLPEVSDLMYLLEPTLGAGYGLQDSGRDMVLSILPEIKFNQKTYYSIIQEFPILSRAVRFLVKFHLVNKFFNKGIIPKLDGFVKLPKEQIIKSILLRTDPYPSQIHLEKNLIEQFNSTIIADGTTNYKVTGRTFSINDLENMLSNHENGYLPLGDYSSNLFNISNDYKSKKTILKLDNTDFC